MRKKSKTVLAMGKRGYVDSEEENDIIYKEDEMGDVSSEEEKENDLQIIMSAVIRERIKL